MPEIQTAIPATTTTPTTTAATATPATKAVSVAAPVAVPAPEHDINRKAEFPRELLLTNNSPSDTCEPETSGFALANGGVCVVLVKSAESLARAKANLEHIDAMRGTTGAMTFSEIKA
jgi:hypothetical protein